MPIRPFLAGQALEPDVIRQMPLALEMHHIETGVDGRSEYAARGVEDYRTGAAWGARCTNSKHNDPERVQSLLIGDAWGSLVFQQLRQLGDIGRDPPRLVARQGLGR